MTKILVVDDEASIVKLVTAYLKPEGYEVLTAADGTVMTPNIDAMAALQNNPFGTRPYKANLTARYRFDTGPLKGAPAKAPAAAAAPAR